MLTKKPLKKDNLPAKIVVFLTPQPAAGNTTLTEIKKVKKYQTVKVSAVNVLLSSHQRLSAEE